LKSESNDLYTWNDLNLFHANTHNNMKKIIISHILQNLDMEVNENAVNKTLNDLNEFEK